MEANDPAAISAQEKLDAELDALVASFLAQRRRGEFPSVEAFARQHPAHCTRLLELLPTMLSLESCADDECLPARKLPTRIGEYEILDLLGRGGMGVVYLAQHPQLDRKVAIKVLPSHLTNDEQILKRFCREANAIAQLQHPNVVTLFELDCQPAETSNDTDIHYFVMQYIEGASLDAVIHDYRSKSSNSTETQRAGLSATKDDEHQAPARPAVDIKRRKVLLGENRWQAIARIGADAADGLTHAHEAEILHRDIKPSNLIIDRTGKTWIADFGLARLVNEDASRTDGVPGTLRFIAPERFRGWSDPRSDIYSLGVTLYEIATLHPAIEGSDRAEIIANITKPRIKPPRQRNPDIPRDLETIICKAIAASPDDRYESAAAMRDDLLSFLNLRPIKARRSTLIGRTWQWVRHNPSIAALLASIAILLVALALGSSLAAFSYNDLAKEIRNERDSASRSLLLAYINEAHAHSTSNRIGQRTKALSAIKNAVNLLPEVAHEDQDILQLRNEMIAALTLPDLEFVRELKMDYSNSIPSPDFKYVASSAQDGLFRLRDALTGRVHWSYQFQGGDLNSSSCNLFSPDSSYVAAFSHGTGRIRLFDCRTGKVLIDHQGPAHGIDVVEPVAFDEDSRFLTICGRGKPILLFDLLAPTTRPKEIEAPFPVTRAFFQGKQQLIAYDPEHHRGDLVVVDLLSQKTEVAKTRYRTAVSWRPTKGGLVVGCADGTVARVDWPQKQRVRFSKSRADQARKIEVNDQNGLMAVQAWGEDFFISDTRTGNTFFSLWGVRAKFSDAGDFLAVSDGAKMRFYRVHSNRRVVNTSSLTRIGDHGIRLNKDGDSFLVASWSELQRWSTDELRIRESKSFNSLSQAARFLSDGRIIAIVDKNLTVFDVADNSDGPTLGKQQILAPAFTNWLTAASDTDRIAWQTPKQLVRIASVADLDSAVEFRSRNAAAHPYFELSPDGKLLAIADGTIRLIDAKTAALIHDFGVETRGIPRSFFRFRPDGQQMICHTGAEQLLIDLSSNRVVRRFSTDGYLGGADWSPDGKMLARVVDGETIVLLDSTTLDELARIRRAHALGIRTIRFGRDGMSLLASVNGVQIHRWDLDTIRQELSKYGLDW